jgi:predicted O-methyltransferase YrrM
VKMLRQIRKIEQERRRLKASTKPFRHPELGANTRGTPVSTVGEAVAKASTPMRKGLLLRHLARDKKALELGTGFGFGAAYIASSAFMLDTVDKEWHYSSDTGLYMGTRWGVSFDHALFEFKRLGKSYDFAHIDGHHTEAATLNNYVKVLNLMPNGGVIAIDDIHWSDGMKRAWNKIKFGQRHISVFGMGVVWIRK